MRLLLEAGRHAGRQRSAHLRESTTAAGPTRTTRSTAINLDGTGLKQLTGGAHNNLNPCWLPDGGIAFISDRKPAYAYCFVTTSPVLYRMDRDGSNQRRLSANYLMDFTPAVLDDGRIIYTRWEYVDRGACPIQSLWTINPDGTGLAGFFGNRDARSGHVHAGAADPRHAARCWRWPRTTTATCRGGDRA